jgi:putative restriction endonuclease
VTNGLAFCKIHHAAYDSHIVGVRPDGVVQVRCDVLEETNGPNCDTGCRRYTVSGCCCLPRRRCGRPWRGWSGGGERFRAVG